MESWESAEQASKELDGSDMLGHEIHTYLIASR
jgi:hypothetical protein